MRRNLVVMGLILTLAALGCRMIQPSGPESLELGLKEVLDRFWGPGRTQSVRMKDGVIFVSMRMGQEFRPTQREWTYNLARFVVAGQKSVRDIRVDFAFLPPPSPSPYPQYDCEPWGNDYWEAQKSELLRKKCQRELDQSGFLGRVLVLVDAVRTFPQGNAWLPNVLPPEENPGRYGLLDPPHVSDSRESERLEVRLVARRLDPTICRWLAPSTITLHSLILDEQKGDNLVCVELP